jgi:hypothetical protein
MKQDEEGFFDFLLGYRKTLAWFSLFAVSIVLLIKGYINGGQWETLCQATFLGFITGNISEHLGNLGQSYFNSKLPPVVSNIIHKEEGQ